MANGKSRGTLPMLAQSIVARLVAYYAALGILATLAWRLLSPAMQTFLLDTLMPVIIEQGQGKEAGNALRGSSDSVIAMHPAAFAACVAILSAFLLALPVSWVYMYTRQKKGYQQSVVHSLIVLPLVVAGTVALVKNSTPLAFSVAGIIAAVRFRTRLDDSKDAVYLFLASALGLASAVQLDAAVVISVLFNAIVLALWYTDFARTPPALEGMRAQRQLERALAVANRTSMFVAQVDRQILDAMAPEQLDALASRVRRRKQALEGAGGGGGDGEGKEPRYDTRLVVDTTDPDATRRLVEPLLEVNAKRWRFDVTRRVAGAPHASVEYELRLKKSAVADDLIAALRREGTPFVVDARMTLDTHTPEGSDA